MFFSDYSYSTMAPKRTRKPPETLQYDHLMGFDKTKKSKKKKARQLKKKDSDKILFKKKQMQKHQMKKGKL